MTGDDMATIYEEPPSADEVMRRMAHWVARIYGLKVTVKIEGACGESTTVIDRRPPPIDVCTDPDNCPRCKAHMWDKYKHSHAGLSSGKRDEVAA